MACPPYVVNGIPRCSSYLKGDTQVIRVLGDVLLIMESKGVS